MKRCSTLGYSTPLQACQHHHLRCHWDVFNIHDFLSENLELIPLHRLRHVVAEHLIRWTVMDTDIPFVLLILYEEESDVEMPGPLASAISAIAFQQNGSLVVLVKDIPF